MNKQKIVIILAATLLAAIAIIVIFIVVIKRGQPAAAPDYNQYIEDLKKQGAGPNGQNGTNGQEPLNPTITYGGVLITIETGLSDNILVVRDSQTGQTMRFNLNADTAIIYGAKSLSTSDLHAGDELSIIAQKNPDQTLQAKEIRVTVSTSPTVPTQVNVPVETPGVILPPSKRNIL